MPYSACAVPMCMCVCCWCARVHGARARFWCACGCRGFSICVSHDSNRPQLHTDRNGTSLTIQHNMTCECSLCEQAVFFWHYIKSVCISWRLAFITALLLSHTLWDLLQITCFFSTCCLLLVSPVTAIKCEKSVGVILIHSSVSPMSDETTCLSFSFCVFTGVRLSPGHIKKSCLTSILSNPF